MKKQVKRVRRAANDTLGSDVLIERLKRMHSSRATKRWLAAVRAEAQTAVVALYERLRRGFRLRVRRVCRFS